MDKQGNYYSSYVGKKFGRLTILKILPCVKDTKRKCLAKCSCGVTKQFDVYKLKIKHTRSCGCFRIGYMRKNAKKWATKHGYATPRKNCDNYRTYCKWSCMIQRCRDIEKRKTYLDKNITVCRRWNKFENFLKDMGIFKEGETLDRVDNSKGYCKSNCRKASCYQQTVNRSNTIFVYVDKSKLTLTEVVSKYGKMSYAVVWYRLKKGWDIESALTFPHRKRHPLFGKLKVTPKVARNYYLNLSSTS